MLYCIYEITSESIYLNRSSFRKIDKPDTFTTIPFHITFPSSVKFAQTEVGVGDYIYIIHIALRCRSWEKNFHISICISTRFQRLESKVWHTSIPGCYCYIVFYVFGWM